MLLSLKWQSWADLENTSAWKWNPANGACTRSFIGCTLLIGTESKHLCESLEVLRHNSSWGFRQEQIPWFPEMEGQESWGCWSREQWNGKWDWNWETPTPNPSWHCSPQGCSSLPWVWGRIHSHFCLWSMLDPRLQQQNLLNYIWDKYPNPGLSGAVSQAGNLPGVLLESHRSSSFHGHQGCPLTLSCWKSSGNGQAQE